jgi:hypothetical protein
MNADLSTSSEVKCAVPAIQSLGSVDTFTIDKAGTILGEILVSPTSIGDRPFDLLNLPGVSNSGSNCYIGTKFEGDDDNYYVGKLSEVRFFIDWFADKAVYIDNLVLQGSNTGFTDTDTITTIMSVGDELHEGWNYYKFGEMDPVITEPEFRYYRLFSTVNDGCDKIGEVNFIG